MKFTVTATDQAGNPIASATTVSVNIGNIGSDGLSAYEIAVADGFVGDETAWLASLHGEDGAGVVASVEAPLILTGDVLSLDTSGLGAVDSVNGETGVVVLDAADVGADSTGTASTAVAAHSADTTSVHGIADTSVLETTTGSQAKVAAHTGDTSDAHDASAISFTPAGTIAATDVQAALAELDGDSRMSDSRTPTAHATSHQDGSTDELALDGSQITTGTVADARIASTIARDSEVATAVSDHVADTADAHALAGITGLQAALDAKAPLASPALTGNPTAPTQSAGNNSTRLATTAYADTADGLLVPKSLVDAKGDLFVGSAADTVARLAVGTDTHVLTADAASTNGVKWAAAAGGTPTTYAVKVSGSSSQSITTSTFTPLTLATPDRDDGGFYNAGVSTTKFKVPASAGGWYYIEGNVDWTGSSGGAFRYSGIYINGVEKKAYDGIPFSTAGADALGVPVSGLFYLAVADEVELNAFQNKGSSVTISAREFAMIRLAA